MEKEKCKYCEVVPRELLVDRTIISDGGEKIKISSYVVGDDLYTGTYIEKFAENFMNADEICNEYGDLEYKRCEKINFCPKCGRKLA